MVVVENMFFVYNLVVCMLCFCYLWFVFGLVLFWYKFYVYWSCVVCEFCVVLKEFGVDLDECVEVNVWDSIFEVWYLVIFECLEGLDGMSEI